MRSRPREARRRGAPLRLVLLAAALLGALAGCMRPPEPPPPPSPWGASHRVRLLGEGDEVFASFRVRRRSVAVSDKEGIRIGRASSFLGRVEVTDRLARLVWVFREEAEGTGAAPAVRRARVERGDGELCGFVEVSAGGARVTDAQGVQIGEVRAVDAAEAEGSGAELVGQVFGAPGTDLLYRLVTTGRRVVEVKGGDDVAFARLEGLDVDPRAVGLMVLPAPGEEGDALTPSVERLYEAGVLLFVRVYGD